MLAINKNRVILTRWHKGLPTMNLDRIIEITFALSGKRNTTQRCRHFSFICDRNRILSIGMNSPKTHPFNLKYNYINKQKHNIRNIVGTHSELSAVLKLGSDECRGLTIINTRVNRKNEIDFSHPCIGCMDMINKIGFKRLGYTTRDKKFEFVSLI